jgi:hypothetical protein
VPYWAFADGGTESAGLFGHLIMDARRRNLSPMSEWWLGTIIATWCVALAGSEGLEEAPSIVFCLLAAWCGIFSVQLLAGQPWEAGATFVAFLVAGAINSQMQRVRQSRNE